MAFSSSSSDQGAARSGSGFARAAQAGGLPSGSLKAQLSNTASLRPMMRALIEHPGIAADAERFATAIDELVGLRRSVTEQVVRELWPNDDPPDPYKARAVRRKVAEVIGDLWRTWRDAEHPALEAQTIASHVLMLMRHSADATAEPPPFENISGDIELQLSLGRAATQASPTIIQLQELPGKAATLYIGEQSVEDWIQRLRTRVGEYGESIADVMAGDREARGKDWRITYQSVVSTLGDVIGQSAATQYRLLSADLKALDKAGQRRYLDALPHFPDGVLMERIQPTLAWTLRTAYPQPAMEAGITVRNPSDPAAAQAGAKQSGVDAGG